MTTDATTGDATPTSPPAPAAAQPADPARAVAEGPGRATRPGWTSIVRDVVLIVLGAALALGGEEWRDSRERARRLDLALAGIRSELTENRRAIAAARARHVAMRDSLRRYVVAGTRPPFSLCTSGIFTPAVPLSTAWQAARETGALNDLPYATVLVLGRVYERQARYRTLADALTQAIYTEYQHEGVETYLHARCANYATINEDLANREEALGNIYDDGLAAVGDSAAPLATRQR